jgi:pimeloyl-ACP methyl ester carboxylesterase
MTMATRFEVTGHGGIRLAGLDFGGTGPGILLLHGAMDRATTWVGTARWLTAYGHVVAIDQRGHGRSDAPEGPYDRAAFAKDAVEAIWQRGLGPALVIGHSMGGMTAWQVAGWHPDLVRGIVIGDMEARRDEGMPDRYRKWFATWPVPFTSLAEVREFFGAKHAGQGLAFTENMAEDAGGYRPLFSTDHIQDTVEGICAEPDHFPELARVRCPALVVRGELSALDREESLAMAAALPRGRHAGVPGAGHVLHWDNPDGWREAVEPFVREVVGLLSGHVR